MKLTQIRIEVVIPVILILFSFFYIASNLLAANEFSLTADEGYYFKYCYQVSTGGVSVLPELVKEYFNNIANQFYPPPTRLGYIWVGAQALKINPDVMMLGVLSFFSFLLVILIHLIYCSRIFGATIGLWSTVLLSSSPLVLAMARRALTDSFTNLLFIASFWLFLDYLINRQRYKYVIFLGVFILALLSRENTILMIPFYILFGWLWPHKSKLNLKELSCFIGAVLLGVLVIPGLVYGFDLWIKAFIDLIMLQPKVFNFNPYVMKYCSGEWSRYIIDQILLNPIVTLLFIGFMGVSVLKEVAHLPTVLLIAYYIMTYVFMSPLQKNVRYVISLEMVLAVGGTIMLINILNRFRDQQIRNLIGIGVLMCIFMMNYATFNSLFIQHRLLDPITFHLMHLKGFL